MPREVAVPHLAGTITVLDPAQVTASRLRDSSMDLEGFLAAAGPPVEPRMWSGEPSRDTTLVELRNEREYNIRAFCDQLADLLVAKQRAYGPAAISNAPGGPINGLRVRIFDKHARFQNLLEDAEAGDGVLDESVDDTAADLAGYGVIAALVIRGLW
jgi:hypothetical protein